MFPTTPSSSRKRAGPCTPTAPRFGPHDDSYDPYEFHAKNPKGQTQQSTHLSVPGAPLTPAETPVNRKAADTIGTNLGTTGRVLFPVSTPKKTIGSGRKYPHTQVKTQYKPRVHISTANSPARVVKHTQTSSRSSPKVVSLEDARNPPAFEIFNDADAFKKEVDSDNQASTSSSLHHPHKPLPPDTKGMWYIFRGKKVFRPFADGGAEADAIKQRNLFGAKPTTRVKGDPFAASEDENDLGSASGAAGAGDEPDSEDDDTDREEEDRPVARQLFVTRPQ